MIPETNRPPDFKNHLPHFQSTTELRAAYLPTTIETEQAHLYHILNHLIASAHHFDASLVFVGGTITDMLHPDLEFSISPKTKSIVLANPQPLQFRRSDGTIKDIDAVLFCPDREKANQFYDHVADMRNQAHQAGLAFPPTGIEPTYYFHPDSQWPPRKLWSQFTSSIDHHHHTGLEEGYHFSLDTISQPVSDQSIEPWKLIPQGLPVGPLPAFHPRGHALRYQMRNPSGIKAKDSQKLQWLEELSHQILAQTTELEPEFNESTYTNWHGFIEAMATSQDPRIAFKRWFAGLYWRVGAGSFLSHSSVTARFSSLWNR